MDFGEAIKGGFTNYATFRGRAARSEFWWWTLFTVLVSIGGSIVDGILGTSSGNGSGLFEGIVSLALLVPGIAVTVRRLHDTDHSGWWYWLVLTIVGVIPLLIWICSRGTPSANIYGPDPLAAPARQEALDGAVW